MYDRQTETLWSHFTGEGIVGELTGNELSSFPLATVGWATWRDANPDGRVLSRETGHSRDYGRNPYPGYDDVDGVPFLFQGEVDGRYTALTRMVGVEHNGEALGVPLVELQEPRVATGSVGGDDVVVWWTAGTSSALDALSVSGGRDVGATGVFLPVVEGEELTFSPAGDATFTDTPDRLDLERARACDRRGARRRTTHRAPPCRHLLVRLVDVPERHRDPVTLMRDILLPRSDRTALVQVIVVLAVFVAVTWFVRRERALMQLAIGAGLVVLAAMAMRTLH